MAMAFTERKTKMINKISKRATKVMCVVLTAAMLMSDFGITSVSATELSEQEAVSELFSSEEQAEEQTAVSESQSEPRRENDGEEAVSSAESEAATTVVSTEMTDESSETEKFEIQETQETQTPETDTEATTEEETMAVGDSSDTDFEYAAKIGARFVGRNIQAEQVTITPDELCIAQGAQATLTIHVTPADFTDNVTWKTSDETIVSVSQNGIVTAKKIGEATVTVTVGTVSATCKVSVQNPVKSIVLNKTSVQIETAKTVQLTVTVLPENAANQQIGWSSSDETIAKVDENGLVTAVAEGSATITATALDGSGISAECTVMVVKTGTEIKTVDVPVYKTVILNTGNGYADKTINAAINGLKDNVLEVLEVKGVNKNAQKVQGDLEITANGGNVKIGIHKCRIRVKQSRIMSRQ